MFIAVKRPAPGKTTYHSELLIGSNKRWYLKKPWRYAKHQQEKGMGKQIEAPQLLHHNDNLASKHSPETASPVALTKRKSRTPDRLTTDATLHVFDHVCGDCSKQESQRRGGYQATRLTANARRRTFPSHRPPGRRRVVPKVPKVPTSQILAGARR